jgi:Na+/proline symporter
MGDNMIKKKMFVFIISLPLFAIAQSTFMSYEEGIRDWEFVFFELFGFVLLFSAPFILVLGMPVSALSDFILEHQKGRERLLKAFAIHLFAGLFFGVALTFMFEGVLPIVASTLAAFVVWIVDEILKSIEKRRAK